MVKALAASSVLDCRRSFSSQTFHTTYWLKRPELLPALFWRVLSWSGYRQIAREFGVSPTTVLRQVARLGRPDPKSIEREVAELVRLVVRERTPQNPLFLANVLDLLIRHNGSNHKRETIAFSKRRQSAAERLAVLQV